MSDGAEGFGARLRARRSSAGLSQEELAERSGLSIRTISDLERGHTRWPYRDSLSRLADALGLAGPERAEFIAGPGRRLAQAPAAATAADDGIGPPASRVVPRQLPAPVPQFTGRRRELAALTGLLGGGPSATIAVIGGPGGVGKTALAVHWAHQAAASFPDGQLFVSLRGFDPAGPPVSPAGALGSLVEGLGVPAGRLPRSADALAGLYRSLLAGRRVLIVLDNARDAAQVRPLLAGSPGCLVVITSRSQLTGLAARDGAVQIMLAAMGRAEARQLLTRLLGGRRARGQARAIDQVADGCGRLPLALGVTAARAAMRPGVALAEIAADLAAARDTLDGLTVPDDPAADVRAAFSWSYQSLAPASQRMFRLLGLHPGPDFSAEAAASLAGVPPGEAALLVAGLAEASLLSVGAGGRFALHDLLAVYAGELAARHDHVAERRAATGRMLDHYLVTAMAAARVLEDTRQLPVEVPPPGPGAQPEQITTQAQALAWLGTEYAVLVRLVDLAAASGFDVHAWQLPRALHDMFDTHARWEDWDRAYRTAAGAAQRLGDRRAQALTYLAWAQCETYLQRWPEAEQHLHQANELFSELADRPAQARVLVNLGRAVSAAGRYQEAVTWAERAYRLYLDLGDPDGQAGSLANQGVYHRRLGDPATAKDLLTRAQDMFTAIDHRRGQGLAANNLGLAWRDLGDHRQAIGCQQQAVRLFSELAHQAALAECLNDLADAYQADGQQDQAIHVRGQALAILTELRHPDAARTRAELEKYR